MKIPLHVWVSVRIWISKLEPIVIQIPKSDSIDLKPIVIQIPKSDPFDFLNKKILTYTF